MITNIKSWKIFEKKQKNAGIDIVIVDVQETFKKFFGDEYIEKLNEYCEDYKRVFQIWDSTKVDKPDYTFPNQVQTYVKKYGGSLKIEDVEQTFTEPMWQVVKDKLEAIPTAGDLFETKYGESWVYIGAKTDNLESNIGHDWFLCSKELMSLFKSFKQQERQIILCGGAAKECLFDIYVTMKTLGINVDYNLDFVYSSKGSQFQ